MLLTVEWSEFTNLVKSNSFTTALKNSLTITTIATIISILLAYTLAYTINRTNIKHREILKLIITGIALFVSYIVSIYLLIIFSSLKINVISTVWSALLLPTLLLILISS
mgnify:CR=1 FL=1